jgi:hypothetical protein
MACLFGAELLARKRQNMAGFFLLNVPWGLIGLSRTRTEISEPSVKVDTSASVTPYLFCDDDADVYLNGRPDALELFFDIRTRLRERQFVFDLPIPLYADEPQSLSHQDWRGDTTFKWSHGVDRPKKLDEQEEDGAEPGAPLYRFVLAIMARMHDFEAALSEGQDPWDFVLQRWIDVEAARDPTMDILVRHALEYRSRWSDIAEHPRRILNRRREQVPLSRVQELDTACMQWLSRQPGNTLAQRAGDRQRILALARYENRNTLENRVLRDLLERSAGASREYLALNADRVKTSTSRRTARYAIVMQYGRECRRIARELEQQGIERATDLVQPNYVLLHDNRYRHVWPAWQEIIRRERAMDDLWRWQRRAWVEFCKVALALALTVSSGAKIVAASPLYFRTEHRRGEWLLHDDPLLVIANDELGWVAEVLTGNSPDVPHKMRELGAAIWIRYSDYSGGEYVYLPVWVIHANCQDVSLADLVEDANESFGYLRDKAQLAGGLLFKANIEPEIPMSFVSSDYVTGFAFSPWDPHLPEALGSMADEISELLKAQA